MIDFLCDPPGKVSPHTASLESLHQARERAGGYMHAHERLMRGILNVFARLFCSTAARARTGLGRNLSGNAANVTIANIIAPLTQYEKRIQQFDLRLIKNLRRGTFDVYQPVQPRRRPRRGAAVRRDAAQPDLFARRACLQSGDPGELLIEPRRHGGWRPRRIARRRCSRRVTVVTAAGVGMRAASVTGTLRVHPRRGSGELQTVAGARGGAAGYN